MNEPLPQAPATSSINAHERAGYILAAVIIGLVLILGIVMTIFTVSVTSANDHLECVADRQSEFMAAVGDAFDAPPAPNKEREAAVVRIQRAAKALDLNDC